MEVLGDFESTGVIMDDENVRKYCLGVYTNMNNYLTNCRSPKRVGFAYQVFRSISYGK